MVFGPELDDFNPRLADQEGREISDFLGNIVGCNQLCCTFIGALEQLDEYLVILCLWLAEELRELVGADQEGWVV